MQADRRFRWLLWLSLSEIGTMLVFSNYSALLPILQKEWSLSNSQAGSIYSSYQAGYILSVVFLTSLTDYTSPKYIYLLTAFWAGISGILFSFWANGFYPALVLRTLMGIGFAGTYMPGLRMVSEKFSPHERGTAVGIYVAAFTLGASISFLLTGILNPLLSWRWAFLLTSLGPIVGGVIAFFQLGPIAGGETLNGAKVPLRRVGQDHGPAVPFRFWGRLRFAHRFWPCSRPHESGRCPESIWLFPKLGVGFRRSGHRRVGGAFDHLAPEKESCLLTGFLSFMLL